MPAVVGGPRDGGGGSGILEVNGLASRGAGSPREERGRRP